MFMLVGLFCLFTLTTFSQTGYHPEGVFLGTLRLGDQQLRIGITVHTDNEGAYTASLNSIDQGSGEINFDEVKIQDPFIYLMSNAGIIIEGEYNSDRSKISGEFRQGPYTFALEFERVDYLPLYNRPQEPQKPYPYLEEEIIYKNEAAGIQLAATLTIPKGKGPFPAVVLLTGSGAQNRDEEIVGHKPFLVLADYLTRNGIAVLRADDRGIGGSTGDFNSSTTGDFADDGLAGVNVLKSRSEIISSRIGLIGHSEGGMMAPIAATRSDDVAFIVLLAGPGSNLGENVLFQQQYMSRKNGASDQYIEIQAKVHKAFNEIARKELAEDQALQEAKVFYSRLNEDEKYILRWNENQLASMAGMVMEPWWRYALRYNPEETIGSLKIPVLAFLGEKDQQVPVIINQKELERAIALGHEKNRLFVVPGVNHLFQRCESGDPSEYIKNEETMSPEVMELIKDWIINL